MRSIEVKYDDGETRAALTVRASTMRIETKHAYLLEQARRQPVEDPVEAIMQYYAVPDFLACTDGTITIGDKTYAVENVREPLPLAVFADLPKRLADDWNKAVYELNPHWLPVEQVEAKKEAATSTDASSA
jgi:hypothetical protein